MKKVVNEVVERTISIDDINNESFVGVLWNSRTKSIVITCGNGEYIGINDDTIGLRHAWKKQTKKLYVETAMKQDALNVYVFEDNSELLNWFYEINKDN
jgi:hypothetical protein